MLCCACEEDKLSNEFVPFALSDKCNHPLLICLRCANTAYNHHGKCPYNKCTGQIGEQPIEECKNMLNQMFPKIRPPLVPKPSTGSNTSQSNEHITIVMLTGERLYIKYRTGLSVAEIKDEIKTKKRFDPKQQKLIHGGKELKEHKPGQYHSTTLDDYEISAWSILQLLIVLYDIPSVCSDVTFKITWKYPDSGKHHLDASCFIFNGTSLQTIIFYAARRKGGKIEDLDLPWYKNMIKWTGLVETTRETTAVQHTGHFDEGDLGCQKIDVHLKNVKPEVTHIFFTLSARDCPTIADFSNTRLQLYESSKPDHNLCVTEFTHAKNSQSVVICYLARNPGSNTWQLFRSGKLSGGNAKDFGALKKTLRDMMNESF